MSLLVVGSIALDTVETADGRMDDALGGSAVYFSYAASFFTPVRLVGVVGGDFPAEHRALLEARQIDTAGLEVAAGETFRWHGRYHRDMNVRDTVSVDLNVFGEFDPKLPASFVDSKFVFLANGSPAVQQRVRQQVTKPTFVVADTMNLWIETTHAGLLELLGHLDALMINDEEARMLTGEDNLVRAGRGILAMGPRACIVKKGEHGAILFSGDEAAVLPAYPVERVVDPTGAGDSFAGGMMGYLASVGTVGSAELKRALAYGTVVASLVVEDFSLGRLQQTTREEIDARLDQYRDMMTF